MAKIRCGVAPTCLEYGCYERLDKNERMYPMCNTNQIESEIHKVLSCPLYNDIRDPLLVKANDIHSIDLISIKKKEICIY